MIKINLSIRILEKIQIFNYIIILSIKKSINQIHIMILMHRVYLKVQKIKTTNFSKLLRVKMFIDN